MPVPEDIQVHVLDMEINGGCNYKCQMCPQSLGREKEFLKKLPMPCFEKVIDDAMQYGLQELSRVRSRSKRTGPELYILHEWTPVDRETWNRIDRGRHRRPPTLVHRI
jgi:hypothetical protein